MTNIRPVEEIFEQLIGYKVATIKHNKYVYSPEFNETVAEIRRKPPSKRQQVRYGKQAKKLAKTMALYIKSFSRSRKNVENLIIAYTILQIHLKRLNIPWPNKEDEHFVIYATWYLNDNEPDVLPMEVEGEESKDVE